MALLTLADDLQLNLEIISTLANGTFLGYLDDHPGPNANAQRNHAECDYSFLCVLFEVGMANLIDVKVYLSKMRFVSELVCAMSVSCVFDANLDKEPATRKKLWSGHSHDPRFC